MNEQIRKMCPIMSPCDANVVCLEVLATSDKKLADYVKVSWDTKALDAVADDYVKAAILPYRKETQVAPSIGKPEVY